MIQHEFLGIAHPRAGQALAVHRSRKRIAEFRLHQPTSLREASELLCSLRPNAVAMAGGVDLVNRLKFGRPVDDLVHLGAVPELFGIHETPTMLTVGALTTHWQFERSEAVRRTVPVFAETWRQLGNVRIRLKGTLGGNMLADDPKYDALPAFLALGARLAYADGTYVSLSGEGPAPHLYGSESGALLLRIEIPRRARYLAADRSQRPIVSVWLALDLQEDRVIAGRVAIGCAFAVPMVFSLPFGSGMRCVHLGEVATEIALAIATAMPEPLSDNYASAGYRRKIAEILLRRQLIHAAAGARP